MRLGVSIQRGVSAREARIADIAQRDRLGQFIIAGIGRNVRVIDEAAHAADIGIEFGEAKIDLDKLRGFKNKVVSKLTGGLSGMAKQRKVRVVLMTRLAVGPENARPMAATVLLLLGAVRDSVG